MIHRLIVQLALCSLLAAIVVLIQWQGGRRRGAWLLFTLASLLTARHLWRSCEPFHLYSDFSKAYYPAGWFILKKPALLYSPNFAELGFVNLPIVALPFAPLSHLPFEAAQNLFLALGVLAAAGSCLALVRWTRAAGWRRAWLIGLFVVNGPLYYSLREGNLTHFVLPLLIVAIICIDRGREWLLGLVLAAAAVLKPPLALLLCYAGFRRRWHILGAAGATLAVLGGVSLLLVGIEPHLAWWQRCIQPGASKPVAAYNVQSLSGFVARLVAPDATASWHGLDVGWDFKVPYYLLLGVAAGATAGVLWRVRPSAAKEGELVEWLVVLTLALLISPISWTHYYLFLLVPLSLYAGGSLAVPDGASWWSLLALVGILTSPPVLGTASQQLGTRLLVSHYLLGGVLLLGLLLAARRRLVDGSQPASAEAVRLMRPVGEPRGQRLAG